MNYCRSLWNGSISLTHVFCAVICGLGIDRGPYELDDFEVFHPVVNATEVSSFENSSSVDRTLLYVLISLAVVLVVFFTSNLYLFAHVVGALLFSQRRHLQRSIGNQVSVLFELTNGRSASPHMFHLYFVPCCSRSGSLPVSQCRIS
jgi:hypothetical protein